jgi:hypothetical protein
MIHAAYFLPNGTLTRTVADALSFQEEKIHYFLYSKKAFNKVIPPSPDWTPDERMEHIKSISVVQGPRCNQNIYILLWWDTQGKGSELTVYYIDLGVESAHVDFHKGKKISKPLVLFSTTLYLFKSNSCFPGN